MLVMILAAFGKTGVARAPFVVVDAPSTVERRARPAERRAHAAERIPQSAEQQQLPYRTAGGPPIESVWHVHALRAGMVRVYRIARSVRPSANVQRTRLYTGLASAASPILAVAEATTPWRGRGFLVGGR